MSNGLGVAIRLGDMVNRFHNDPTSLSPEDWRLVSASFPPASIVAALDVSKILEGLYKQALTIERLRDITHEFREEYGIHDDFDLETSDISH